MKYLNVFIFAFIFSIFTLSLVSSAPPGSTIISTTGGLNLESPSIPYISIQENQRFHVHVINDTTIKTNLTTICFLHFYNSSGFDTDASSRMEFESYNGIDFALTVGKGNYSTKGYYSVVIQCNSSNQVGFIQFPLVATNSGKAEAGDATTVFIWILFILTIVLLFYTFFMTIFKLVTADETVYDVLLAWGSYILLIVTNYVGAEYLLRTYVETITGQLLTLTVWTNGVLPLLAFIITFFIKSTQKKKVLSPVEIGGFRYA